MSIKELAEKYIKAEAEAWETGNCDNLQKLEDPDVIWHLMARNQEVVGWEAHKQFILGAWQMVLKIKDEWEFLTGDDNMFALHHKSISKFRGGTPGSASGDKETTSDTLMVMRLKNGRVAEVWTNGSSTIK